VHAAAAGIHLPYAGRSLAQRIRDASRRQLQQGRLHVRRIEADGHTCIEPVEIEVFATGAFRRRQAEVGILQQPFQKQPVGMTAARPRAAFIPWRAADLL
jgi:hypothetical protein